MLFNRLIFNKRNATVHIIGWHNINARAKLQEETRMIMDTRKRSYLLVIC